MRRHLTQVLALTLTLTLLLTACQPIQAPDTVDQTIPSPTKSAQAEPANATSSTPLVGTWTGTLRVAGMELEIVVEFVEDENGLSATIDIPQQGAADLPLHSFDIALPAVHFEMLEGPQAAVFDGLLNDDGSLRGVFSQSGVEGQFELMQTQAEEADATAATQGEERYTDPYGRFAVPVPTNWQVTEGDGYATLSSPENGMIVHVLALESDDPQAAVEAGWKLVNPNFDLAVQEVLEQPAQQVEQVLTFVFDTDDDERFVLADAFQDAGVTYLMLYDGNLETVQRRMSQLQIISSGFDILALEQTDLTNAIPRAIDDGLITELEAYIEDAMVQYNVPGAAVAIVQGDELVYAEGFGERDPATGEPVTPETRMMIGSTSKTLTTLLMATLVDAGQMKWETRVQDVLPDFVVADPTLSEEITLKNLVCACTGVPRRDLEIVFNGEEMTAEDVLESLQTFEFYTDFGEAFQYSNQMVAAGGYAAAAADGGEYGQLYDAYDAAVRTRVLEPMGMNATTLSSDEVMESDNYAVPHTLNLDMSYTPAPVEMETLFLDPIAPAGAYWSNVLDMARYLQMQLAEGVAPDGSQIVSPENLNVTRAPQVPIAANADYGLGWIVGEYKGQPLIQHGGNTLGFTSDLAFLPDAGVGISVLTNGRVTNFFNEGVRYRLLELLFDQPQNAETQIQFSYDRLTEVYAEMAADMAETVEEAAVAPYLGRFTNPALGEIALSLLPGETALEVDTGGFQVTMRPLVGEAADEEDATATGFLVVEAPLTGAIFQLTVDDAGEPLVVLGQGVEEYIFTPLD